MEVSVVSLNEHRVVLSAPLQPNINHREAVFGGSATTLAILAAWSLLYTRLQIDGIGCRLVIQRNTMTYDRPMTGSFTATAQLADDQDWSRFTRTLVRRGKARCTVDALLGFEGEVAGRFSGEFVALGDAPDPAGNT